MSGPSQDGIFVAVFFGAFFAVTIGEIYWLSSKLRVPMKKAITAVFLPNFATITLGFLVTFILFGILLAAVSNDRTEVGSATWMIFIAALGFPFLFMTAIRRLLIGGTRIEQIPRPLVYSLISTIIFFAAVCGLPAIFLALR